VIDDAILEQAAAVLETLRARGLMLATAESCTGGLIAAALTHIPGSSDVVERGFVTYSNAAKTAMLDVPAALIQRLGAVSESVAGRMAEGAIRHSSAHIAVSVTGVAGPGGGSVDKPVGLVWFGCMRRGGTVHTTHQLFTGDRAQVRAQAVAFAFKLILDQVG
jgi:nicotinamide-nucleotide amidase